MVNLGFLPQIVHVHKSLNGNNYGSKYLNEDPQDGIRHMNEERSRRIQICCVPCLCRVLSLF